MCIGCRTLMDKRDLKRIVRTPEGEIKIDATGKMAGRGAYICGNEECLKKAIKNKSLERAFKQQVGEEIKNELTKNELVGKQ